MIQFNLLPDVKQEYIKAKRQKHSVIVISLLAASASLFIFVMLFLTVNVFQKGHIGRLTDDIKESTDILNNTKDLDKILTIQNQLNSLPELHDAKPVTSRLFGYMTQVTPAQVTIGDIQLNYEEKTLSLTGTADSLSTINKFVDTLKFTTYVEGAADQADTGDAKKPFSDIVLASFARSKEGSTYQITLNFDSEIFNAKKQTTLIVPKTITTRSETEKPKDLFQELPKEPVN